MIDRYPRRGIEDIRITKFLSNWLSVSRLPDSLVDGGGLSIFVFQLYPSRTDAEVDSDLEFAAEYCA